MPRYFVFFTIIGLAIACKPSVGSSCDKGEARCVDTINELACSGGHYIATPCRGPKGCAITGPGVACDISKNRAGDACATDDEGAAACLDGKRMVVCRAARYEVDPCRGPGGCKTDDGRALCDTSVAEAGDACKDPAQKACTPDHQALLACEGGKLVVLYPCRGDEGCQANPGGKLDCDLSVAAEGDVCDKKLEGQVACSADRHGIVKCVGGKFSPDERCKAGQSCSTAGGSIACAAR